jgi:Skp family chaperone for outer membrane proteins
MLLSKTTIAKLAGAITAGAVLFALGAARPAAAQQSQDYFVPGQPRPAQQQQRPRQAPQQPPQQQQQQQPQPDQGGQAEQEPPLPPIPMPPVPQLPALPKGTPPPAIVVGVIGVPEVMHASTSAQQVERVIGERRAKLNDDAQKEQASWRDMQQALAIHRSTMSPEQIRGKERELQERITNAQRQFRDRNRIIQEAAQVALNQIQAALIAVIRQVAESHDMNLVLHRQQVALNVAELDITEQVGAQLNAILPSVTIPPDGVDPLAQQVAPVPIQPAPVLSSGAPAAPTPPAKKP